jgi:hypothetical protein
MITIQRAYNGWFIIDKDDEEERIWVFHEGDDEKTTAEAFADVLWRVKALIGPSDSRYSAHRVTIGIEPGDKHSSHPDNQDDEA